MLNNERRSWHADMHKRITEEDVDGGVRFELARAIDEHRWADAARLVHGAARDVLDGIAQEMDECENTRESAQEPK